MGIVKFHCKLSFVNMILLYICWCHICLLTIIRKEHGSHQTVHVIICLQSCYFVRGNGPKNAPPIYNLALCCNRKLLSLKRYNSGINNLHYTADSACDLSTIHPRVPNWCAFHLMTLPTVVLQVLSNLGHFDHTSSIRLNCLWRWPVIDVTVPTNESSHKELFSCCNTRSCWCNAHQSHKSPRNESFPNRAATPQYWNVTPEAPSVVTEMILLLQSGASLSSGVVARLNMCSPEWRSRIGIATSGTPDL